MRIEQLMEKVARICHPGHGLRHAAQMMWNGDCGCLPVTAADGSQRLLGMITDRDICMAIRFEGSDLGRLRVEDAMTAVVRACNPDDPVFEAIAIMAEAHLRRLPVVDGSERVVGLLSLTDLALEAGREAAWERPELSMAEIGGLLAAISLPHRKER